MPGRCRLQLQREAGVSAGVVTGMAFAGSPEVVLVVTRRRPAATAVWRPRPITRPGQRGRRYRQHAGKGFGPVLLGGVTGSGKTEVYFDAVSRTIAASKQVLILLPEMPCRRQSNASAIDRGDAD